MKYKRLIEQIDKTVLLDRKGRYLIHHSPYLANSTNQSSKNDR